MHPAFKHKTPRFSAALLLGAVLASNFLAACDSDSGTTPPASDAQITLTSPKGGETFKVGQTIAIKWTTQVDANDPMDEVDPKLSSDGGATWINIRTGSIQLESPSYGNFAWTIPDTLVTTSGKYALAGKSWLLKVSSYKYPDNPKKQSKTTTPFTISVATP